MSQNMGLTTPSRLSSVLTSWAFILPSLVLALLFIWQFTGMQTLTGGAFSYALDDAYIHLALSENIMKGHYGVNLQDYSAPSSSILWSFIMAPLAGWQYWPLCVNFILSLCALWLWSSLINRFLPHQNTKLVKIALNLSFLFLANLVGVSFTGMENLLQLVLSMIIVLGLFDLIEKKPNSTAFFIAIILAPLVRYETISLSGTALLFLAYNRQFSKAAVICILMLIPLVGFSLYIHSLGLGYLPSSITAKSSALQSSAILSTILNFYNAIYEPTGSLLVALLFPLLWFGLSQWNLNRQLTMLTVFISAAVICHLFLGRIGNWGRYEIYIWISLVMTLIYCFKPQIYSWFEHPQFSKFFLYCFIVMFTVLYAKRYIVTSTMSKVGGANIALQQFQMHRFVTDYWKDDVAVNDLGWVAYKNDHYVLDLWGLANKEALDMRKAGTPDMLKKLTEQHQIKLALIYEDWFKSEIPASWIKVASLHLPDEMRAMTPADSKVDIFATDPEYAKKIKDALQNFESTLPGGAYIRFNTNIKQY